MTEQVSAQADHAASMDRMYRMTRHVYDATRKYYLLGRDRMIRRLDVPASGRVLEMGCGTGRNLIEVARRYPTAEVYGIDISEEMLKTARAEIAKAGLSARIRVAQADATCVDPGALFGIAAFDRVYFSYTLSMIPDWRSALVCAHGLIAEGGSLLVVDFGAGERLPGLFRRLLWQWLRLFHVTPRLDMQAALVAVGASRRLEAEHPYGGYAQLFVMG